MGARAQEAVTFNSRQTDINLLRLLGILASGASDETGIIDPAPTRTTLAKLTGCTPRTITNRIGKLIESGELEELRMGSGPGNPSAYRILLEIPEDTLLKGEKGENIAPVKGEKGENLSQKVARLEHEMGEIKALIFTLLGEKGERVKAKGGKGESERVKGPSTEAAHDPYFDPILDPEEEGDPPNPPFGFKPSPTEPAYKSPADKRVGEILEVCHMSADIPAHLGRAELAAAQLKDVSAGYIRDRYSQHPPNGVWGWYQDDWRGRKGEVPTPELIIETIYLKRTKRAAGPPPAKSKAEQELAEYEQMRQGVNYE